MRKKLWGPQTVIIILKFSLRFPVGAIDSDQRQALRIILIFISPVELLDLSLQFTPVQVGAVIHNCLLA